jgi:hypothetical protein
MAPEYPFRNKRSLAALIKNSLGCPLWRNFYYSEGDAMENGDLSCAFYVSTLLLMTKATPSIHGTVKHLSEDMESYGWYEIAEDGVFQFGDVLIWEPAKQGSSAGTHQHIGFFMEDKFAVSNSSSNGFPVRHHLTYNDTRKVVRVLRFDWPD